MLAERSYFFCVRPNNCCLSVLPKVGDYFQIAELVAVPISCFAAIAEFLL